MEKCINNQTDFNITVTLYVAELIGNILQTKEAHTIDIKANEIKEVECSTPIYSFISGIDVVADANGNTLRTSQKSGSTESPFSVEVNEKYYIDISGFRTLDIDLTN